MRPNLWPPIGIHPLDEWAYQTELQIEVTELADPGGSRLMDACAASYLVGFRAGTVSERNHLLPQRQGAPT